MTSSSTALRERAPQRRIAPGLGLTALAVVAAMAIHTVNGAISPLVTAVVLGAVAANSIGVSDRVRPGVQFAAKRLLRVGVVLLGFQLSLGHVRALGVLGCGVVVLTVAITFLGTRWVGHKLGLSRDMSLLVATGFSICGASAIAAIEGVADADEDDVALSIGLVTIFGTLAIVVLPAIAGVAGLDGTSYGYWIGASVHDVGQVVAAASPGGAAAVSAAVLVKLSRVLLLAPLVASVSVEYKRRDRGESVDTEPIRPPIVPLFVVGFLAAVVVRSTGLVPTQALDVIGEVQTVLLAAALFGLGCGVHFGRLRRVGARPLVLGMVSWTLIAGVAYVGTSFLPS